MARFAVIADESGNAGEALQVLAGISGPAGELLALERRLRRELKKQGLSELKWAGLRKRKERFDAARAFFALLAEACTEGSLGADILVIQGEKASRAWGKLEKEERWMALYKALISRARRRRRGRLSLYPDQRTGMRWQRLRRALTLREVRETSSSVLALVQLADLLAGLLRFSRLGAEAGDKEAGAEARRKRSELARDFASLCAAFRLGPKLDRNGALVSPRGPGRVRVWEITKLEGATRVQA